MGYFLDIIYISLIFNQPSVENNRLTFVFVHGKETKKNMFLVSTKQRHLLYIELIFDAYEMRARNLTGMASATPS